MTDTPIAFQGEVMLAGWQETHNGGAKITFWLPTPDLLEPFRLATVRKGKTAGQRYMAVLVEIDTDEKPVDHPSNAAHLKLTSAEFLDYAISHAPVQRMEWDSARAREWAKYTIGVKSLSEIDTDAAALERYHRLVRIPFDLWLHRRERTDGNDDLRDGDGLDEA